MSNHERGLSPSREDIIKGSVTRRAAREARIISDQSLRSEEWRTAVLIDRGEPRVKVNDFGEVLTMSYRMRQGDHEHVQIEIPRKYMDIDQAIRGNAHSKDGSSEAKNRISSVLDIIEATLEDLKIGSPTKVMITTAKEKARQRLIQEGFINTETGKTQAVKPRRKKAIEQSLLRELDISILIAGRALIARTVEAAAGANWLLELLAASFADFKAETVHNFLSRNRKDAVNSLSTMVNFAESIEQNLLRKRDVVVSAQIEALQKVAKERLDHRFRPHWETELFLRLLILKELDLPTLETLFMQQHDEQEREKNFRELRKYSRELTRIDELAHSLSDDDKRIELLERIRAIKGVARGTITFSKYNLGHSRRHKTNPNPKFGFETERLPFIA